MKILVSRRCTTLHVITRPRSITIKDSNWIDTILKCSKCGSHFQLGEKDRASIQVKISEIDAGELGLNNFVEHFVKCPECNGDVELDAAPVLQPISTYL